MHQVTLRECFLTKDTAKACVAAAFLAPAFAATKESPDLLYQFANAAYAAGLAATAGYFIFNSHPLRHLLPKINAEMAHQP